jgi:hypothetical protein
MEIDSVHLVKTKFSSNFNAVYTSNKTYPLSLSCSYEGDKPLTLERFSDI